MVPAIGPCMEGRLLQESLAIVCPANEAGVVFSGLWEKCLRPVMPKNMNLRIF